MRNSTIMVTAFDWVPSFAQGSVRDLRVRWALEEAALPYEPIILRQGSQGDAANLAHQPFAQVPAMIVDGASMFESGAIVWRIACETGCMVPPPGRARDDVLTWVFAALNTMEPAIAALSDLDFFVDDESVKAKMRPVAVAAVERRLTQLDAALGDAACLSGAFSVADLMMTTVLRDIRHTDILTAYPKLQGYVDRQTARPAFIKALADQLQPFSQNAAHYEHSRRKDVEDIS